MAAVAKVAATVEMESSWFSQRRMRRILSQRKEMGREATRRRRIVRWRVRLRRWRRRAPKAWPQMGSMPMASPERTE
ncbi:hypothetical protein IEQ34_003274 [Dendrobium chrysotoxum]|uniref:Uncharacterized protein n=1 Tax=Dendrobium chrysotoxum TaxID=161865 RepID=A0AAV7HGN3_DENCH|nr:hypothetical protein IEQ34_003274 [Dendrobium chrysotoxum]